MSKKRKSAGAQDRDAQRAKDLAKAEKHRALEKERASDRRKQIVERLRSGELKIKKLADQSSRPVIPCSRPIRKDGVVMDEHTTLKKVPNHYRLEGYTGW